MHTPTGQISLLRDFWATTDSSLTVSFESSYDRHHIYCWWIEMHLHFNANDKWSPLAWFTKIGVLEGRLRYNTKTNTNTNTNEKWSSAARFTKIGVPEGRVEGKSRLCNFAIHGNKFRGRWEKSFEKKDSIKSLFPQNVSLHYSLFSGTVARSCFLQRTLEPTQRRWTVRTSSSESLDRGFASSLGTLTFSMGEPSKDMLSYFFFSLMTHEWLEVRDFTLLDFLCNHTLPNNFGTRLKVIISLTLNLFLKLFMLSCLKTDAFLK